MHGLVNQVLDIKRDLDGFADVAASAQALAAFAIPAASSNRSRISEIWAISVNSSVARSAEAAPFPTTHALFRAEVERKVSDLPTPFVRFRSSLLGMRWCFDDHPQIGDFERRLVAAPVRASLL